VNLFLSWGAQVDYGFKQKAKLMHYHHKDYNALAYHRAREMIAANILGSYWVDGKNSPADIASNHWSYP
jgi:hypothetical protein